jgi:hypothetical protein
MVAEPSFQREAEALIKQDIESSTRPRTMPTPKSMAMAASFDLPDRPL